MDSVLFGRVIDAPLDEPGARRAQLLAQRLAPGLGRPIIEASPRVRTQQTAAAIAAQVNSAQLNSAQGDCEVCTREELDEIDFGSWSARTFRDLDSDPAWRRWNTDRENAATPAGETIAGVQRRVMDRLQALAREHSSRTIVVVTHSEIIRSLVLFVLGASPNRYDRLTIDPASITRLSLGGDTLRVDSLNEHLA
jgi:broad specificity phosphatase PhoE